MIAILLVDDDTAFRTMLRITLRKLGFEVREAADGREAVREQKARPADLLLTDLIMPEREGLETIQEFRRLFPTIPIIAMSGGGRSNARDLLVVAKFFGAGRTLAKPFSREELLAAIAASIPAPAGAAEGGK